MYIFLSALSTRMGWVHAATIFFAPCFLSASMVFAMVPPVDMMSSIIATSLFFTSSSLVVISTSVELSLFFSSTS